MKQVAGWLLWSWGKGVKWVLLSHLTYTKTNQEKTLSGTLSLLHALWIPQINLRERQTSLFIVQRIWNPYNNKVPKGNLYLWDVEWLQSHIVTKKWSTQHHLSCYVYGWVSQLLLTVYLHGHFGIENLPNPFSNDQYWYSEVISILQWYI